MRSLTKIALCGIGLTLFLAITFANASATTYYIDYVQGSDSNNGTSEATPWKHQPYMHGWTGSYTHQPGDRFIFKGGVTWDHTCFEMAITQGGSPGNYDYYGVDQTWYSGSSWSRPIFNGDLADLNTTGGNDSGENASLIYVASGAPYIEFDSFELTGLSISGYTYPEINLFTSLSDYMTVNNCYLHNWQISSSATNDSQGGGAEMLIAGIASNSILQNSTISNSDNTGRPNGLAVNGFGTVRNCTIHDVASGLLMISNLIGCMLYNISNPPSFDTTYHDNVAYIVPGTGVSQITGNTIHDFESESGALYLEPDFGDSISYGTINVENNLVYNLLSGSNPPLLLDPEVGSTGKCSGGCGTVNIYNNTIISPGYAVRVMARGTATINSVSSENNQYIIGASTPFTIDNGATTPQSVTDLSQSSTIASGDGYTTSNLFEPTGASSPTVGNGTNLYSLFTTDILGHARPSTGAWDIGAYEAQTHVINPPNGLRIAQ